MLGWLDTNASAVQAFSALANVILTAGLVAATLRYVILTKTLAETTKRQLAASIQPLISMSVTCELFGETRIGDLHSYSASGNLSINNQGTSPLKLKEVFVALHPRSEGKTGGGREFELISYRNRLLLPGDRVGDQYVIESEHNEFQNDVGYGLHVVCTDLPELAVHDFVLHPDKSATHKLRPAVETGLVERLQRASARIETKLDQIDEYRSRNAQ
jgi:hypothetical protein